MSFERNPDPLRKKIEIDPAAEDRLAFFIDEYKKRATEVIAKDTYANDTVRQLLLGALELLTPSTILASMVDNRFGIYGEKTLREQFKTWMEINFITRELGELKQDAFGDRNRVSEGTVISMLTDELRAILRDGHHQDE